MIRVYALTNLWPLVDADVTRDTPAGAVEVDVTDGDTPDMLEALEGVFTLPDLVTAIGRSLTKNERDALKRDHELEIDDGTREIRQFDIEPDAQVKGWVEKSFKTGVVQERERLWNLVCYFREKLLEADVDDKRVAILAELREMLVDGTVAPSRYHMKGVRIGKKIAESGSTLPSNRAAEVVTDTTAADPCIECGSPLDDEGYCHFVDCGKAVAPLVDLDNTPVRVATPVLTPAEAAEALLESFVCNTCGMAFGPNPDKMGKWPDTVCLTKGCRDFGRHVASANDPRKKRCKGCNRYAHWDGHWWRCQFPDCKMLGIGYRDVGDVLPADEPKPPAVPRICPFCAKRDVIINSLTKPGQYRCCSCLKEWPHGPGLPPADDCCVLPPPEQRPIPDPTAAAAADAADDAAAVVELTTDPVDGKVPIAVAIRDVLAEIHAADPTNRLVLPPHEEN